MSAARAYPIDTEPSPADVARWQRELDRDMSAADRVPVAMMEGPYGLPLVVCRDGSCHQLHSVPLDHTDGRAFAWQALPPIPGSPASLTGEYLADARRPR